MVKQDWGGGWSERGERGEGGALAMCPILCYPRVSSRQKRVGRPGPRNLARSTKPVWPKLFAFTLQECRRTVEKLCSQERFQTLGVFFQNAHILAQGAGLLTRTPHGKYKRGTKNMRKGGKYVPKTHSMCTGMDGCVHDDEKKVCKW